MKRILIANRGEIAVRIARACADTGRTSLAIYADQDADAVHVRAAHEAYALNGTTSATTYLDIERIIAVARAARADAVHPGYGFRSESAEFARAVEAAGMTWIGPSPQTIEALGDKVSARRIAERVGAPLAAGSPGPLESAAEAVDFARTHGLPVVIKAAHGGGGRGMRVAWSLDEVAAQFESAVREATQAFGRPECFVEKFLDRPRHVEVQILADKHGTVLALGTRDCSLQRRNQKLVEEAPAPFLTPEQNARLLAAAADVCREAGYDGAGTVEFLLSATGDLSFLEVNTRLQVEHPVTEETTGIDLVEWQFRIAEGERIDPSIVPAAPRGHAFEFRINAEDPGRGFLPAPGTVTGVRFPGGPGVRVDSGVEPGSSIPGAFDSLMAKVIVWGPDRTTALARSRRAIAEMTVDGVPTVLPFHRAVLEAPEFAADRPDAFGVHTRWIETDFAEELAAQLAPFPDESEPVVHTWVQIDGRRHAMTLPAAFAGAPHARDAPHAAGSSRPEEAVPTPEPVGDVRASVAGSIVRWLVDDGDTVEEGQGVVIVEAMKMETEVRAQASGQLVHRAESGQSVLRGERIGSIE